MSSEAVEISAAEDFNQEMPEAFSVCKVGMSKGPIEDE